MTPDILLNSPSFHCSFCARQTFDPQLKGWKISNFNSHWSWHFIKCLAHHSSFFSWLNETFSLQPLSNDPPSLTSRQYALTLFTAETAVQCATSTFCPHVYADLPLSSSVLSSCRFGRIWQLFIGHSWLIGFLLPQVIFRGHYTF